MKRLVALLFVFLAAHTAFADSASTTNSGNTMNFRFSPVGLIFGAVDADLDFTANPNWTVGPTIGYAHMSLGETGDFTSNINTSILELGVRANWFKNGVFKDGLYVGPSLTYDSVNLSTSDAAGSVTANGSGLFASCLVGYGWFWNSFNIMLGGGATVGLGTTTIAVNDSSGDTTDVSVPIAGLALEFSLGWTF